MMETEESILHDIIEEPFSLEGVNFPAWKGKVIRSLREAQDGYLMKSLSAKNKRDTTLFEQISVYLMWMIFSLNQSEDAEKAEAIYENSVVEDRKLWEEGLKDTLKWIWRRKEWQEKVAMAEAYSVFIQHLKDPEFKMVNKGGGGKRKKAPLHVRELRREWRGK